MAIIPGQVINGIADYEYRWLRDEVQELFNQDYEQDPIISDILQVVGTDGLVDNFQTIGPLDIPQFIRKGEPVPMQNVNTYMIQTELKYFGTGIEVDRQELTASRLIDDLMTILPARLSQASYVWFTTSFWEFLTSNPGHFGCLPPVYSMLSYDQLSLINAGADHVGVAGGNQYDTAIPTTAAELRAIFYFMLTRRIQLATYPGTSILYWANVAPKDMDIKIMHQVEMTEMFQEAFENNLFPQVAFSDAYAPPAGGRTGQGGAAIENIVRKLGIELMPSGYLDSVVNGTTGKNRFYLNIATKKKKAPQAIGLALVKGGYDSREVVTNFPSNFNITIPTSNKKQGHITIENLGPGTHPWVVLNQWISALKGFGGYIAMNPYRIWEWIET